MGINKDSNGYVFGFAAGLVIVVGTILTLVSVGLKPMQKANIKIEKMQNILQAVKISDIEKSEVGNVFAEKVTRRVLIDYNGNIIGDTSGDIDPLNTEDAFNLNDQKQYKDNIASLIKKYSKEPEVLEQKLAELKGVYYPIYVCENEGNTYYVLPMVGTGLWGPVWGYVGLSSDYNTIYGSTFDHKSETPGLGAEIKEAWFGSSLEGKTISEGGEYVGIDIIKPGSQPLDNHKIDGITGGTITSVGVAEMVKRSLRVYNNFFNNNPNF